MALLLTFAEWLEVHGLPDAIDLSEYDRVTIAWLQYHRAVAQRVDEALGDPVAGENLRVLYDVLSEDIIDSHLGHGWFTEHVDGSASSDQTRNFLKFDGPPAVRLLAAQRVHDLARRLYQLQSFPWFDAVVRGIRTRDLSGAGFELDIVFLLHHLMAGVVPKEEVGRKGEDYDIHLKVYGLDVPVEAKAKDDDTPYNERTVINTVKGAATQLPKGSKGIVFMRIPSGWVGAELQETYPDALAEATRQTGRVGAVVTVIDKMALNDNATAGHVTRHYQFFRHRDCPDELWEACLQLKEVLERNLIFFAVAAVLARGLRGGVATTQRVLSDARLPWPARAQHPTGRDGRPRRRCACIEARKGQSRSCRSRSRKTIRPRPPSGPRE
jgi:hypothetical protein